MPPTPTPELWNTLANTVPELVVFGLVLAGALFFLIRLIIREFVEALEKISNQFQEGTIKVLDTLVTRIDALTTQITAHDTYARTMIDNWDRQQQLSQNQSHDPPTRPRRKPG